MAAQFDDLSTPEGLKMLDQYLFTRSYISGYVCMVKSVPSEYQNLARWYKHVAELSGLRWTEVCTKFSRLSVDGTR
nr:elongation factor 1-delta-like isoform X2 [Physcomitrium patens]|eukprot:XP_024390358.1 elongation factor 1-delta-like isoform X2 [Physcomitrella patens]